MFGCKNIITHNDHVVCVCVCVCMANNLILVKITFQLSNLLNLGSCLWHGFQYDISLKVLTPENRGSCIVCNDDRGQCGALYM